MMRPVRSLGAAFILVCLLADAFGAPPGARAASVLAVPGDYATIQAAIDAASAGDTVLVAPGMYVGLIDFHAKEITVESSGGPDTTTIDGNDAGTVVTIRAEPAETPVLRGFTITNGYGGVDAGGVQTSGGPALIEGNHIVDNLGCNGAGIVAGASEATIQNNTIARNGHSCSGGIGGGVGLFGAGTVAVLDNIIIDNEASAGGGGIGINGAGHPTIERNIISGNVGGAGGGGLTLGNHSDARIANNLISFNQAAAGGAIEMLVPSGTVGPTIVNNTFVGNTAGAGATIYASGFDADSRVANNVIVGATTQASIECTTLYDPLSPQFGFNDVYNTAGPEYGGACGDQNGTNGNVSVDPRFLDAANADYHLRPDSPLIDAGTNAGAPSTDIDGDARPFDGDENGAAVVDPGFDESTDPVLIAPTSLAFGTAPRGIADTPVSVTLTNYGGTPLVVSDVSIGGANAGDFSIATEDCTTDPVPAATACIVTVGFKPSALGVRAATLSITGPSPLDMRTVTLGGTGAPPPSGVAWGTSVVAGPSYTWNSGSALGRTVQSSVQRLHLAYATNRVGGKWATDTGPYAGVYYTRSSTGTTWSTATRLNPSTQHATQVTLAATGSRVYAAWVSQTKLIKYSPTAARVLYVRVNTSHGDTTAWRTTIRLSSTSGRVGYPTIAATGSDVYVAWTDSVTGSVRVSTSRNAGGTWTSASMGTTTAATPSGKTGVPSVSASGATVAVVWLADAAGTVKGRVSTDHGATWGPVVTVGTGSIGFSSVAVRGSRIAVAWTTLDDVVVRQRIGGTWESPMVIASLVPGADPVPYAPVVSLQDPARIAVSWSEELATTNQSNLRWVESADGGSQWFAAQTLASTYSTRRANDWPSVLWPSAYTRYVVWNGWTPNSSSYRLYLRKGSGTPVGPTVTATVLEPPSDAPLLGPDGAVGASDSGVGGGFKRTTGPPR